MLGSFSEEKIFEHDFSGKNSANEFLLMERFGVSIITWKLVRGASLVLLREFNMWTHTMGNPVLESDSHPKEPEAKWLAVEKWTRGEWGLPLLQSFSSQRYMKDSRALAMGHELNRELVKVYIMSYPTKPTGKGNETYKYGLLCS